MDTLILGLSTGLVEINPVLDGINEIIYFHLPRICHSLKAICGQMGHGWKTTWETGVRKGWTDEQSNRELMGM